MLKIPTRMGDIYIAKIFIPGSLLESIINSCPENCQVVSVKCWEVVLFATIISLKAFKEGRNVAKTVKGEILIRLAQNRQIREAIEKVGAREGENILISFGSDSVTDTIRKFGLKELPLEECKFEEVLKGFEKIAIIEAL
ncbi:KEOPS complex subunit Cgi121 [Thermococcus chitonophagus]|nr:KEOPS complex subunit Cgi121 [Thermococcus chitonophagus]CUX78006.1 Uncharacterized protein MJ0187 [Thermococcus chitonophagus]